MSDVITPDFGLSPMLNKGDFVRFIACDCCHGIVVDVQTRYPDGQAQEFSVAIPLDSSENGNGGDWEIEENVSLEDVVRVVVNDPELVVEKSGTVLQFEDAKASVR
jgi:hypothetical protein